MINPRFITLAAFVVAAAATRLLPHAPNFTPIAAMALFGGAYFAYRPTAFALPLAAMLLSDLVIGLHAGMPFVYGAFAMIVGLGLLIRNRRTPLAIAGAALTGSIGFFLLTNFGTWLTGGLYPLTGGGLLAAYTAAIPYFAHTLTGDAFYTAVLFGGFALAQRVFPLLREEPAPAPAHG